MKEIIFCEDCKYFNGDGDNCIDDITIGISGIPLSICDGFKPKEEIK